MFRAARGKAGSRIRTRIRLASTRCGGHAGVDSVSWFAFGPALTSVAADGGGSRSCWRKALPAHRRYAAETRREQPAPRRRLPHRVLPRIPGARSARLHSSDEPTTEARRHGETTRTRLLRVSVVSALSEAGAAELLAEVFAFHLDNAAHFMKARTHALSDAVAEGLGARGSTYGGNGTIRASRRLVLKICRNDGGAVVVVAGVQDEADGVPNPFGWLDRAQFVKRQNVGLKNGAKHVQFGGLNRGIVRILDLLEQFAIVIKKAGNAFVQDQFLDNSHSEACLHGADPADDQHARAIARIVFLRKFRGGEVRKLQRVV